MSEDRKTYTCKERFDALDLKRRTLLTRARTCAAYTNPSIMPAEGITEEDALRTPYQSLGAYAVNNLASKLLLVLFPPNTPFFKFTVDKFVINELKQKTNRNDIETKINTVLSEREYLIQKEIEAMGLRVPAFKALKYLITTGNCLCVLGPTGGMKVYRLDQYVVRRDPRGMVLEICIKESTTLDAIEDEQLRRDIVDTVSFEKGKSIYEEELELYTYVVKDGNKYNVKQELAGVPVPGSEGTYPLRASPFIPLRWTENEGENYGRGHVEEFLGDFISYEGIMKALFESSGAAAKTLFLVNPTGTTDIRDLVKAPNCGFVQGTADDIAVLGLDKYHDMQIPFTVTKELDQRLSRAFLLHSTVQRDAERVTAQEIRYLAAELEDALGGIYSVLSEEFQRPLVETIILQLEKSNKLPAMPSDNIQLVITTGIEALGRGHDLTKLMGFMQDIAGLGAELILPLVNVRNLIERVAAARGINTDGLIKTEEELAMEQKQAQQQQLMQQLGPVVTQGGMDAMNNAAVAQAQSQAQQQKG